MKLRPRVLLQGVVATGFGGFLVGHQAASCRETIETRAVRANLQQATQGDDKSGSSGSSCGPARSTFGAQQPQFPFLVEVSPGDNPSVVMQTLCGQDPVVGSRHKSFEETLRELSRPSNRLEQLELWVGNSFARATAVMNANVPDAFAPGHKSFLDQTLPLLSEALRMARQDQEEAEERKEKTELRQMLTIYVRGMDAMSERDARAVVSWAKATTCKGLANVVLETNETVTSQTHQRLSSLSSTLLGDVASYPLSNQSQDGGSESFVAVLMRVAKGQVDVSDSLQKLRLLQQYHALSEFFGEPSEKSSEPLEEPIVGVVGNWWRDLESVCELLSKRLDQGSSQEEKAALVHEVCEQIKDEMAQKLLQDMQLDRPETSMDQLACEKTLLKWMCLEYFIRGSEDGTMASASSSGSAGLMTAQQLMKLRNAELPENCALPVQLLLSLEDPSASAPSDTSQVSSLAEEVLVELLNSECLFLRPKQPVEIGVVPCTMLDLVAPCYVEIRPLVKAAFEDIYRNEKYFGQMQRIEQMLGRHRFKREIQLYEQQVASKRKEVALARARFTMKRHALDKAEVAQLPAELSLLELQVEAQEVYLDKLRTLLDKM